MLTSEVNDDLIKSLTLEFTEMGYDVKCQTDPLGHDYMLTINNKHNTRYVILDFVDRPNSVSTYGTEVKPEEFEYCDPAFPQNLYEKIKEHNSKDWGGSIQE